MFCLHCSFDMGSFVCTSDECIDQHEPFRGGLLLKCSEAFHGKDLWFRVFRNSKIKMMFLRNSDQGTPLKIN
mgnify:FL=1